MFNDNFLLLSGSTKYRSQDDFYIINTIFNINKR